MNKIWMFSLLLTVSPALATAPSAGYIQVQSTDANDGAAEKTGAAVDNAAAATGQAVDNAAAPTGAAASNTQDAVNNKIDPNHDGVVDTNNDGVADTRQLPWGLLGLLGLLGLRGAGRRQEESVPGPARPRADRLLTLVSALPVWGGAFFGAIFMPVWK